MASASSRRQMTKIDVGNQARILITGFVHDRMEADGLTPFREEEVLTPETPQGEAVMSREKCREVGSYLRLIGDELDGNERLQTMISDTPTASKEVFLSIAKELFSDSNFNWGRVVALFYFAYKMARKAIGNIHIIQTVIEWIVSFIVDFVAEWIIGRGGWEAIGEYFGSSRLQVAGVLIGCVLTTALVWFKHR